MKKLNRTDQLIVNFDQGLRTLFGKPLATQRANPAKPKENTHLTTIEQQLSMRLMRVNHAGEVSAQALYQGQALTARTNIVKENMYRSAMEENDHLVWCHERVQELNGHVSLLNPIWYAGSFAIGTLAGVAGDKWSLGFVAETEKQVVQHIDEHLQRLPAQDDKTRAILEQMKEDESHHATVAIDTGGVDLPKPISWIMSKISKIMTKTAFWV